MLKPVVDGALLFLFVLTLVEGDDTATNALLQELDKQGRTDGLKGYWSHMKQMPIYTSRPSGRPPVSGRPTVIVAHHAVGVYNDNFLRSFCDSLAAEGFICLLPDLFHRVWSEKVPNGFGIPVGKMNIGAQLKNQRDVELLEDLQTTIELAHRLQGHDESMVRVGVLGFCMGGRVAWLAATATALSDDVQGAVAYHGGNIWKAYPEDADTAPGDNLQALHCPMLGHFAELDQNPSPADKDRLQSEAQEHSKEMEFYSYAGVKHGFSCRDSSFYNAVAADEAWPRTVSFLKRVLATREKQEEL